jgi:rubrerythrin
MKKQNYDKYYVWMCPKCHHVFSDDRYKTIMLLDSCPICRIGDINKVLINKKLMNRLRGVL